MDRGPSCYRREGKLWLMKSSRSVEGGGAGRLAWLVGVKCGGIRSLIDQFLGSEADLGIQETCLNSGQTLHHRFQLSKISNIDNNFLQYVGRVSHMKTWMGVYFHT